MSFPANIELSSLDGTNGFKLNSTQYESAGYSVASADVNGDGFADLIIGAPRNYLNGFATGVTYVVFGKASGFGSSFDLSTLDGTNGFTLNGQSSADWTGQAVASAGDVNNDGFEDVIVAAPFHNTLNGSSYVVFGKASGFDPTLDLSSLDGNNGFTVNGSTHYESAGYAVSKAGDVNGDGFGDLIIGTRRGGSYIGAAYVVFGQASGFGASLDVSNLDGSNGFKLNGDTARDYVGMSVSSAGDVNGDGLDDVIIGAVGTDSFQGASYVVFGQSGFASSIDVSNLDGSDGFRISGDSDRQDVGRSVSSAGDINGDGFDDLLIGASYSNNADGVYSGAAYVVFGKASGFGSNFNLYELNGTNGFRLSGVASFDRTGKSVAAAGDVNGDGFDDVVVGAYDASRGSGSLNGVSYVLFGKASGFASEISLASMDGKVGVQLTGASYNYSGHSVASGDVNGDGFSDVIVGSNRYGAPYVVFGSASPPPPAPPVIELSNLDGSNGYKLSGAAGYDYAGICVAGAGDVNGDGLADVIIGAYQADTANGADSGAAYVVFGQASGVSSDFNLSGLDGSNGFRLDGAAAGDWLGKRVASAGDINGDGFDDVIVSSAFAEYTGTHNSGVSYVVFGKASGFAANIDLGSLDGSNGFKLKADPGYSRYEAVASAGDVNGDGFDDLIIDANSYSGPGTTYVVFGQASGFGSSFDLDTLDGSNGFSMTGEASGDRAGWAVSSAGDINGDGYADVIAGARFADNLHGHDYGASYVVFGQASGFASHLDLSSLNGSTGFKVGGSADGGWAVSSAGDVNGDGLDDIIIGAPGAGYNEHGESYVVFGKTSGFGATLDVSNLDGSNGFKLSGVANFDYAGAAVSSAGDVNGDGFDDLIVGAPLASPNAFRSGTTYVVFGQATFSAEINLSSFKGLQLNGIAYYDNSGKSVSGAGDVNGDGFDDLVVGAYYATGGAPYSGVAYIIYGRDSFVPGVTIDGTAGDDTITPNQTVAGQPLPTDGDDTLNGLGGNDFLNGAAGGDTLVGGTGNDTYVVDNLGDVVTELFNQGSDTVRAAISYDLGAGSNVENLRLMGAGSIDGTGNELANVITGNRNDNVLVGGGGADVLNGGQGIDTASYENAPSAVLVGLDDGGFWGDSLGDTLTGIESLTGSAFDDNLTGNRGANLLTGLAGNDSLDGGRGADTMVGGAGGDGYFVDNALDVVTELANQGNDTVDASISYTLGANVENLELLGTARLAGTGNGLDNSITGNGAANVLQGGDGDDRLVGGGGKDTLTGNLGADGFVLNSPTEGPDIIVDFASIIDSGGSPDTDFLEISSSGFSPDLVGLLHPTLVVAGSNTAANSGPGAYFIYDNFGGHAGTLYFDATGGSGVDATPIAILTGTPQLSATDIQIA